jgi:UDP-N-acetylglucosamine 2-epimerase
MRWTFVVGARPQFIKLAPLIHELQRHQTPFEVIHTGQHYDDNMSRLFFEELNLPQADINLNVGSMSHGAQTGEMLARIEEVLEKSRPGIVCVFGDTNSTLAGALAASKLKIPVAHVEAGLRSFNFSMPEEQNRILTDHLSTLLFCPTQKAVTQLKEEGIEDGKKYSGSYLRERVVVLSGDIMADALFSFSLKAAEKRSARALGLEEDGYALVTIHRAENTDPPGRLKSIIEALGRLPLPLLLPLHPRSAQVIRKEKIILPDNLRIIEPQGYLDMISLERTARCIITDSGGIQKEAYLLKVPCVTIRPETEWPETLSHGWNRLTDIDGILHITEKVEEALAMKRDKVLWPACYGDGDAAEKIRESMESWEKRFL